MDSNIFEKIKFELKNNNLKIIEIDMNRPWGGFFVIAEEQAQEFSNLYFNRLDVSTIKIGGILSPKILVVLPSKQLSWQYHFRRAEIWRVVKGQVGVKRSFNNEEGKMEIFNLGEIITLQKEERHRLIGLDDFAVIAEFWQHIDENHLSDEDDIVRLNDDFGRFTL